MRVVHATNAVAQTIVGVDRHMVTLAVAQKERGVMPMVLTDRPGYLTEACELHDIPVTVVPELNPKGRKPGPPPKKVIDAMASLCVSFGADVIHCHSLPTAAVAYFASDRSRSTCVFTHHNKLDDMAASWALQLWSAKFSIISVSRTGVEDLKRSGVPEELIYHVPNGTNAVPSAAPMVPGSGHPNLILVAGVMTPRKGIDVAVLVMHELRRRRGQDCPVLNIYGAFGQEEFVKEMTSVLGLTDIVRFHGRQLGILDRCPDTDILLVTSRTEAGPIVVAEAMSRGMASVCTDVGEVGEMIPDSRYGRIVPVESIMAFADAVESMLSDIAGGQFDPRLLIERHRSLYSGATMAERVEEVYQALLDRGTPSRPPAAGVGLAAVRGEGRRF